MNLTTALLLVFLAAATPWLEVLVVVPAAVLAGIPVVPVVILAALGNILTLIPVVMGGDRVRAWWQRRRAERATSDADPQPRASRRRQWGRRLFDRYGLPGLALLGPVVTGIHLAAVIALGAGARRRPALAWLSAGVAAWAVLAALATVTGIEALVDPDDLPNLFGTR